MPMKITFNGKQYDSPDAMPPAVRAAYDRLMTAAQQGSAATSSSALLAGAGPGARARVKVRLSTRVRFVKDGVTYENPDEMPPDVRLAYDKAMQQIDQDRDGVPDLLERPGSASAPSLAPADEQFPVTSSPPISPQSPVIAPDRPMNRALITVGLAALSVLIIAALLAFIIFNH